MKKPTLDDIMKPIWGIVFPTAVWGGLFTIMVGCPVMLKEKIKECKGISEGKGVILRQMYDPSKRDYTALIKRNGHTFKIKLLDGEEALEAGKMYHEGDSVEIINKSGKAYGIPYQYYSLELLHPEKR